MKYYYLLPKNAFFKRGYRGSVMHALGIIDGFNQNGVPLTVLHSGGLENFIEQPNAIRSGIKGKISTIKLLREPETRLLIRYSISNLLYIVFLQLIAKNKRAICLEVNSVSKMYDKHYGANFFVHTVEKMILKNIKVFYVVSKTAKLFLIDQLNVPEANILVLPNALKGRKLPASVPLESIAETGETARMVYLGSLQPYYNIHEVCEWLSEFNENKGEKVKLHFYGNDDRDSIQAIGEKFVDLLYFHGSYNNEDIDKILSKNDILILPNKINTLAAYISPIKLFEYMSLKAPILASAVGQNNEILSHNHTALLYNSKDGFFESLKNLLQDVKLRETLSSNAYREVMELHTWEIRIKELIKFWN